MNKVIRGDCIEKMRELKENSVDAVVTDPPYALGFMDKEWDSFTAKEYQDFCEAWGKEAFRVLKHGGHILAFSGTRTYHRMVVGLEDAGFEVRDMIEWVYGSGFPKSHNIGKAVDKLQGNEREVVGTEKIDIGMQSGSMHSGRSVKIIERDKTKGTSEWEGWGTALKPAHEPICMARKPLAEKTVAENCVKWGTGGMNIDESRVEFTSEYDAQEANNLRYEKSADGGNGGEFNKSKEGVKRNQNFTGRFPANLIHDGSDEVRECFPETKGDSPNRKERKGGHREIFVGTENNQVRNQIISGVKFTASGNASRYFKSIFYSAKASKSERNKGCEGLEEKYVTEQNKWTENDYRKGDGEKTTKPTKNNHPTVKPINLMRYLVRLVTREGQVVLDCFAGSGTTGCACLVEGREYVLIEKHKRYADIIIPTRLEYWGNPDNWSDLKEHKLLPNVEKNRNVELQKWLGDNI